MILVTLISIFTITILYWIAIRWRGCSSRGGRAHLRQRTAAAKGRKNIDDGVSPKEQHTPRGAAHCSPRITMLAGPTEKRSQQWWVDRGTFAPLTRYLRMRVVTTTLHSAKHLRQSLRARVLKHPRLLQEFSLLGAKAYCTPMYHRAGVVCPRHSARTNSPWPRGLSRFRCRYPCFLRRLVDTQRSGLGSEHRVDTAAKPQMYACMFTFQRKYSRAHLGLV